jgi:hypothetical protein
MFTRQVNAQPSVLATCAECNVLEEDAIMAELLKRRKPICSNQSSVGSGTEESAGCGLRCVGWSFLVLMMRVCRGLKPRHIG